MSASLAFDQTLGTVHLQVGHISAGRHKKSVLCAIYPVNSLLLVSNLVLLLKWLRILRHYSRRIHLEVVITFKLSHNWSVHQHFFLDLLHSRVEVIVIKVVALFDPGNWLALTVVCALVILGPSLVWRALFRHEVGVLSEVPIHDAPSSVAPLVHIVTLHDVLWRNGRNRLTSSLGILQLESGIDCLDKAQGIARSALSLVTHWPCKVIPIDVSEIPLFGNKLIWNLVKITVFVSP